VCLSENIRINRTFVNSKSKKICIKSNFLGAIRHTGPTARPVLKSVSGQLFQCPGQKRIGLIVGIVDQASAADTGRLLADTFFKEPVKLPIEAAEQFQWTPPDSWLATISIRRSPSLLQDQQ
jgi:hypothetical protein